MKKITLLLSVIENSQIEPLCALLTAAALVPNNVNPEKGLCCGTEDRTGDNTANIPFRNEYSSYL